MDYPLCHMDVYDHGAIGHASAAYSEKEKMKGLPVPNRLIKCWGNDWSEFTCIGKFVPFAPGAKNKKGKPMPEKQKAQGRFFRQDKHGEFHVDRECWGEIDRWEYLNE